MTKYILILAIFISFNELQAQQPLKARTEKGTWVRINPDGTWNRAKPNSTIKSYSYPAEKADTLLKSSTLKYGVWIDVNKWGKSPQKINKLSEIELKHRTASAYSIVTYEKPDTNVTLDILLRNALNSIKNVDPNSEVVKKELRYVNGNDIYCAIVNATVNNIKLTYFNYYYVGSAGVIQFVTYCDRNQFNKYKQDFEDLLNGLIIFL